MMAINMPLYRDPVYDGAADPTIIWNIQEQTWWIFYTSRRANLVLPGAAYAVGTDIGMASSTDGGHYIYRGIANIEPVERGRNTYWAPEIIYEQGCYHMYVSYLQGIDEGMRGKAGILHYTSDNLRDWIYRSRIDAVDSNRAIDATVVKLGKNQYRMYFKDEEKNANTYSLDSDDLFCWHDKRAVLTLNRHEGPNAFHYNGKLWLITDAWKGLDVYSSLEGESWKRVNTGLLAECGVDAGRGGHADILVQKDKAYILYFSHLEWKDKETQNSGWNAYWRQRSALFMAQLTPTDEGLTADRNIPFSAEFMPGVQDDFFPGHLIV